jgi:hypothetical protein
MMRFKLITVILFFVTANFYSQEYIYAIEWAQSQRVEFNGESIEMPLIKGHSNDNGVPLFFNKQPLKKHSYISQITLQEYEIAPKTDTEFLKKIGFAVEENAKIDHKVVSSAGQYFFVVSICPYRMKNGILERMKKVAFSLIEKNVTPIEKDFVSNSVLQDGSGFWYKIAVQKDGIYKIDKNFLESCGVNTNDLNPSHINVFGNGDGVLPELNAAPRTDDLAKNSIFVQGESDGNFDDGDYILFYGLGPHRWDPIGLVEFDRKTNPYSENSYYFININPNEAPQRIQLQPQISDLATVNITSYDYRDCYENDLVNLVGGGQRWYGELFDIELERTFNFSIPNVDSSAVRFKTFLATNASSAAGTSQKYSVNGQVLLDSSLPSTSVDYVRSVKSFSLLNPPSNIPLKISITRNSPSVLTYLDRIVLNARRKLVFYGTQFGFRNLTNSQPGQIANYTISGFPSNGFIWDVSDRNDPKLIQGTLTGSTYTFKTEYTYKEFVASNGSSFFSPTRIGLVDYQNLHGLEQADFLIVSHPDFLTQANRLADLHRAEGLKVHVVQPEHVYNEFSSGAPDACSIRMFAKMFYDRGALNPTTRPRYLLLFGDGTYDPKNRLPNNNNFILTYQVENSENHISAMVTDDFYGMLDDNEAISSADLLDIGIGRILASNPTQAKQQVDKVEHYMKNGSNLFSNSNLSCCLEDSQNSTFGDWRLKYVQIADDEESGYFINIDTEPQSSGVKQNHREINCDKIYLDAYQQETTAGGQRYPDVYNAITDRVQRGQLIVNYVGHGGEVGLAEERVVSIPQINEWTNINRLNLFVSATCEFTKYDDPARVSAGEWAALNPNGASIALMTTTRAVFFGVNSSTGQAFYQHVFDREPNGTPLAFGEIVRRTKNSSGTSDNKRSFTLIGDPALKIALPRFKIVTDSINGKSPQVEIDTLNALGSVRIKGHVIDHNGNTLSNYNGVLIPTVFDKVKKFKTLGQDPSSPEIEYELQRNIVYKGKSSISNGYFDFSFVVPKDIALNVDFGKISYYAYSSSTDAYGFDTNFRIGGINPNGLNDIQGPQIEAFMNDLDFVNGSITDETPVLLVKLFDENGINTVGNGIGHDITAILDGNSSNPIVLNEYYSSDLNSYQSGEIRYQLPVISAGKHSLEIKAWDVNNNSSSTSIEFVVQEKKAPQLEKVYNYPNPFSTQTEFMFEHNQSCSFIDAQIQVYTVSGKLVKTINKTIETKGFRVDGLNWNGLDEFGDPLAKGVYVYRLKIKNELGETAEKTEKLVILR